MQTTRPLKRHIIVTGGDSAFFFLIKDLVSSIRTTLDDEFAIGVIDGGLSPGELDALSKEVDHIVKPVWPTQQIQRRGRGRQHLLVNLHKSALNQLFPGYDVLIWLDGDTWLQTRTAIDYCVQVAMQGKLAVVSESTRYRDSLMRFRRRIWWHAEPRSILFKNARRSGLSYRDCWFLANKPTLNAGVYAMRSSSPIWSCWHDYQLMCAKRGRLFSSDQVSLAMAVYKHQLAYEALPAICNYGGPWYFNIEKQLFLETYCPYEPISVVHMVGRKKSNNQVEPSEVRLSNGQKLVSSMQYGVIYDHISREQAN